MSATPTRGTDVASFNAQYRTRNEGDFPSNLILSLAKDWDLKYGENPNQHAAMYKLVSVHDVHGNRVATVAGSNHEIIADLTNVQYARNDGKGKGGLSLNNMLDISRGMQALRYFEEEAVAIMKHTIVSGFALHTRPGQAQRDLFRLARDADRRSNFGGTVVANRPLTRETAEALFELKGDRFFVDVLAAPGLEEGVMGIIERESKNLRVAEFSNLYRLPAFVGDDTYGMVSVKEMPGGRIGVQDLFLTRIRYAHDLVNDPVKVTTDGVRHVVQRDPTAREAQDLLTAWYLNIAGARSNGVVAVRDGVSVSMGAGQVERVGAVEQMTVKGLQKAMNREGIPVDPLFGALGYDRLRDNPFNGAAVSSDAFFPFRDSIEFLARVGVTAVLSPFGSDRDAQVIDAINEHGMAGPSPQGERCFGHF